jgi:DNA-directed RNA polymerase subunit delta
VNKLKLRQFEGERKNEIAMIRVAKAVLVEKGEVMDFKDIVREVADFLEIDEKEMDKRVVQFYTDMNVDGEFISLGENSWGLRSWYPVDSINEILTHENDEEDIVPSVNPDGFDEYEDAALEEEFKDELEEDEAPETAQADDDAFVDIEGDGTVENLDEYQDDIEDEGLDDTELDGLAIVDDEDLMDEELDEEDDF